MNYDAEDLVFLERCEQAEIPSTFYSLYRQAKDCSFGFFGSGSQWYYGWQEHGSFTVQATFLTKSEALDALFGDLCCLKKRSLSKGGKSDQNMGGK